LSKIPFSGRGRADLSRHSFNDGGSPEFIGGAKEDEFFHPLFALRLVPCALRLSLVFCHPSSVICPLAYLFSFLLS
jgi:hypothetical protein